MSIENKFENREADQEYNDFVKEYEALSGKMEINGVPVVETAYTRETVEKPPYNFLKTPEKD